MLHSQTLHACRAESSCGHYSIEGSYNRALPQQRRSAGGSQSWALGSSRGAGLPQLQGCPSCSHLRAAVPTLSSRRASCHSSPGAAHSPWHRRSPPCAGTRGSSRMVTSTACRLKADPDAFEERMGRTQLNTENWFTVFRKHVGQQGRRLKNASCRAR